MSDNINLNERLDDFWVFPKLSKVKDKREFIDNYFDFLQQSDKQKTLTNLYIHIPFCDSNCLFCPYYKLHGKNSYNINITKYIDIMLKEMENYANTPYFQSKKIASVHFGGGNPFLMSIKELGRIVDAIKSNFDVEVKDNWALEGSINCIKDEEYARGLLDLGINRMSFGVQTFKESIRKKMKMKTQIDEIYKGVEILRKAGFTDYCIDMMYNMPDQTVEDMYIDLEKVTELDPLHIDIYNMALFPNTYLDRLLKTTDYFTLKPSNENQIKMFRAAHKWLRENDYKQIITNTYSRKQDKPHIGDYLYLTNNNVLGVGVSSRGYIDGYSYKNVCSIDEYMRQVGEGNFPADLAHKSTKEEHMDRTIVFFPITLAIDKSKILYYSRYEEKINKIIDLGFAEWVGDKLFLTDEGIVWSGNISAYFIGEDRWNTYINSFFKSLREKTNPYNEDSMGINDIEMEEKCNVPL